MINNTIENKENNYNQMTDSSRINKVFISHSPENNEKTSLIVNLLEAIGINEHEIMTSYLSGYSVPINNNRFDYLSEELRSNGYIVLYLLSEEYYNNVACLNEMGAIWVLKKEYTTILLPGFTYKQLSGSIDPHRIGLDLSSSKDEIKFQMEEFRNVLKKYFMLKEISDIKWESIRNKFIDDMISNVDYDSLIKKDIKKITNKLMKPNEDVSVKTIMSIGYTESQAKKLLNELIAQKYVEAIHYGRYRWIKV